MTERPEMYLMGTEDRGVSIICTRRGCEVPRPVHPGSRVIPGDTVWLAIPLPYEATPRDVERLWMQHRLEHAGRER